MKKQTTTQNSPASLPIKEPVSVFLLKLTQRHAREWATMAARQAKVWLILEGKQLLEYDLVCSGNTGLVNEVATLRGQLLKLVQLARLNEQEKVTLSGCQTQEKATLTLDLAKLCTVKTDFLPIALLPTPIQYGIG